MTLRKTKIIFDQYFFHFGAGTPHGWGVMYSVEKLIGEIMDIALTGWQRLGKPVFLAYLGGRLTRDAKSQLQLTGIPLKSFIEQYLPTRLRLLSVGETGDAVVPRGSDTDRFSDEYLTSLHVAVPRAVLPPRPAPLRYMAGVWMAFERPMSSPKRYIELKDGREAVCHDLDSEAVVPPGSIEILPEDLPPFDPIRNIASPPYVFRAIRMWAEKHQIENARLREIPDRSFELSTRAANTIPTDSNAVDRLRNFLEILGPDDLAKINIPSEVLLRLLKR